MQKNEIVKNWFGERFGDLDPLLQQLHLSGGELAGAVEISYGKGLSGLIGRRLAKKMQLPDAGEHQLLVAISHSEQGLHWHRTFDNGAVVKSLFAPVGCHPDGYWLETTGFLSMKLTVDVQDGGWHWRCLNIALFGVPVPLWLMPKSKAFKTIENGRYKFQVAFTLPLLGHLVSYHGILDAK